MTVDGEEMSERQMGIERAAAGEVRVRRALLSVSDKRGVVELAKGLAELGVEIISTGGTARELAGAGVTVRAIDDFTGFPEMMDGRVKTLHPAIHGGILARRDLATHGEAIAAHGIAPIDLVVSNLYPFAATVARGAGWRRKPMRAPRPMTRRSRTGSHPRTRLRRRISAPSAAG